MLSTLNEIENYFTSLEGGIKNNAEIIEYRYVLSHINQIRWENLSRLEKQQKRKELLEKIENTHILDPIRVSKPVYERVLVSLYDCLYDILCCIELMEKLPMILKRLEAIIYLEMALIDEKYSFYNIQHIDSSVILNIVHSIDDYTAFGNSLMNLQNILDELSKIKIV